MAMERTLMRIPWSYVPIKVIENKLFFFLLHSKTTIFISHVHLLTSSLYHFEKTTAHYDNYINIKKKLNVFFFFVFPNKCGSFTLIKSLVGNF